MDLQIGERVGKRIIPVHDRDWVGHPVVGHVVEQPDSGFYAITHRDECKRHDSLHDAINYIGRLWRERR